VVVLLQSTCLIIWLAVMLVLAQGSRRAQVGGYREVLLCLYSEDDMEGKINTKISHLGPRDRLVIRDSCPAGTMHRVVIHRLLRKNPSVLYCQTQPKLWYT